MAQSKTTKKPATSKAKASAKSKTTAAKKPAANSASPDNPFSFNGINAMETMMTQGNPQFEKLAQDASAMGREGFDAFVKSGTIFAKGFEDLMRETMAFAQGAAEKQSEYMKQAMSVKSLNEWTETQNKIAQASFDDFMSGATKISELSVKLLTEASEPLNTQLSKGMKKATETMAA